MGDQINKKITTTRGMFLPFYFLSITTIVISLLVGLFEPGGYEDADYGVLVYFFIIFCIVVVSLIIWIVVYNAYIKKRLSFRRNDVFLSTVGSLIILFFLIPLLLVIQVAALKGIYWIFQPHIIVKDFSYSIGEPYLSDETVYCPVKAEYSLIIIGENDDEWDHSPGFSGKPEPINVFVKMRDKPPGKIFGGTHDTDEVMFNEQNESVTINTKLLVAKGVINGTDGFSNVFSYTKADYDSMYFDISFYRNKESCHALGNDTCAYRTGKKLGKNYSIKLNPSAENYVMALSHCFDLVKLRELKEGITM